MTKKRIAEIYRFLANASMKRLSDDEKVEFMRLLRRMKPVFTELQDATNDAVEKAKADTEDLNVIMQLVEKAVADISQTMVDFDIMVMKTETFERLCFSNDWTFAQIDELETALVKE